MLSRRRTIANGAEAVLDRQNLFPLHNRCFRDTERMDVVWTAFITSIVGTAVTYTTAEGLRYVRARASADEAPFTFAHSATNGLWVLVNDSRRALLEVCASSYGPSGYQDLLPRPGKTMPPGHTEYLFVTIPAESTVFVRWRLRSRGRTVQYFAEPVKVQADVVRYTPQRRRQPPPEWGG